MLTTTGPGGSPGVSGWLCSPRRDGAAGGFRTLRGTTGGGAATAAGRPFAAPRLTSKVAALAMLLASLAGRAAAQCEPGWSIVGAWGGARALDAAPVSAGERPTSIYSGGYFTTIGGLPIARIAAYDGDRWGPLGEGVGAPYGGGVLVLHRVPTPDPVHAGVTPGLFAAGEFTIAGGEPALGVARWHDEAWFALADGPPRAVRAMRFADHRPSLWLPDVFAGTYDSGGLVVWDGASWQPFPVPLSHVFPFVPAVFAIGSFDHDGMGPSAPSIFAGGDFRYGSGEWAQNIARWDGQRWHALGWGANGEVFDMIVFDEDGDGPAPEQLYVAGSFDYVGPVNGQFVEVDGLARWDGEQWSQVPGWQTGGAALCLEVFDDDGPGPREPSLFVGGTFTHNGPDVASGIIRWDGRAWTDLDVGLLGICGCAYALEVFDEDGDGPNPGGLYVGGIFEYVGSGVKYCAGLARWGCPRCEADCDKSTGPGVLDFFDFVCFQERFAIGDPWACDCDTTSGLFSCDFFDFICFQERFSAGCP